jgi:hypothetical protein
MKKQILIFLLLLFLSILCIGEITILNETTETTIKWNWNNTELPVGVTQLSIDGYIVWNYDPYGDEFILSELTPNTEHRIVIYSGEEENNQTSRTKVATKSEVENLFEFVNIYIFFFVAVIFCIIGMFISPIGILACAFAIMGLLDTIGASFEMGLLFFICLLVGIVECLTLDW